MVHHARPRSLVYRTAFFINLPDEYDIHALTHPQAQHEASCKGSSRREVCQQEIHDSASDPLQSSTCPSSCKCIYCALISTCHALPVDSHHTATCKVLWRGQSKLICSIVLHTWSKTKTPPSRKPAALRPFLTKSPVEMPATAPKDRLRRSTALSTAGGSLLRVSLADPGP